MHTTGDPIASTTCIGVKLSQGVIITESALVLCPASPSPHPPPPTQKARARGLGHETKGACDLKINLLTNFHGFIDSPLAEL